MEGQSNAPATHNSSTMWMRNLVVRLPGARGMGTVRTSPFRRPSSRRGWPSGTLISRQDDGYVLIPCDRRASPARRFHMFSVHAVVWHLTRRHVDQTTRDRAKPSGSAQPPTSSARCPTPRAMYWCPRDAYRFGSRIPAHGELRRMLATDHRTEFLATPNAAQRVSARTQKISRPNVTLRS